MLNRSKLFGISLLVLIFLGACSADEPAPYKSLLTETQLRGEAIGFMNNEPYKAYCSFYRIESEFRLNVASEYVPGLAKMLDMAGSMSLDTLYFNDSTKYSNNHDISLNNQIYIWEVDNPTITWKGNDSIQEYNYIVLDSIRSDSAYIEGRFSANFLCGMDSTRKDWDFSGDPSLDYWVEVRDVKFKAYLEQ